MQVLVISGTFHPESGGPPTYLYHLLPALTERGHTVSVLTFGEPDESDPSTYPYPVMRLTRRVSIPQRLIRFTREVLRQGRRADLLFVSDYGLPAALANLILRKPLMIKIVADFAWEFASRRGWTSLPVDEFQFTSPNWRVRLIKWVRTWYVRRADRVIVPSQHVGRLVTGWSIAPGKLHIIYNALPDDEIHNLPAKSEVRRQLNWPDAPTIITVGRLAEVKRVDLLLQALCQLEDVQLVIVGDGPEHESLQSLAASLGLDSRVTFTGALTHADVLRAIRAADVFALSSRTEGLSHVLIEAMKIGTACVATDVGGNPELIEDGISGLLVPYGDVNALAEAIRRLLDDPQRASQMISAAHQHMRRFSWSALVDQTERVMQEIAL